MANIINATQKPALVLAPNKMLAAQLCNELKEFFPANNIEYFVSYYDYYRPEAYLAVSDVFVEKVSVVNEDIDRLRHSATRSLFERRDTVIVASVSCIYGLGMPTEYLKHALRVYVGRVCSALAVASRLQEIHYVANEIDELKRGQFLLKHYIRPNQAADVLPHALCATLELGPSHSEDIYTFHFRRLPDVNTSDSIIAIINKTDAAPCVATNAQKTSSDVSGTDRVSLSSQASSLPPARTGNTLYSPPMYIAEIAVRRRVKEESLNSSSASTAAVAVAAAKVATDQALGDEGEGERVDELTVYPASHFVTSQDEKVRILAAIREELRHRVVELEDAGLLLEADRLTQRTEADLLQIETVGYCRGVENYARHLACRKPGEPPDCLVDYFPPSDWLLIVDESHISVPQVICCACADTCACDAREPCHHHLFSPQLPALR